MHVSCYRMGEPAELLAKLLGGPVKCYVTRCSLLELKGLGAPFSGNAHLHMHFSSAHSPGGTLSRPENLPAYKEIQT